LTKCIKSNNIKTQRKIFGEIIMYERMLDKNIVSTAKEIKEYMGEKAVGVMIC